MDDQGCPKCKTTKYRNPSLKLLVNVCGHSLCEDCVNLLFIRGSASCAECGIALRRNNFRVQLFEDAGVEKDIDIRKKVLKDFNQKEEDFDSLRDYNDYLEMVETIVYNLSNDIDLEATKRMVDQYKKDNKDQIKKNRTKRSKDEEYLEILIQDEQHILEMRRKELKNDETKQKKQTLRNKEALIEELMFSDMSASSIMARHKAEIVKQEEEETAKRVAAAAFSTGIQKTDNMSFASIQSDLVEPEMYTFTPLVVDRLGPLVGDDDAIVNTGYMKYIRVASKADEAGGYLPMFACSRALHDAFSGLHFHFDITFHKHEVVVDTEVGEEDNNMDCG